MPSRTVQPPRAGELGALYARVRGTTEALCEPLSVEDYVVQSMPDASPTKWHLAHTSWFFETFVLRPAVPRYPAFDERYAVLFNSYYHAAGERHPRPERGLLSRPTVEEAFAYRAHVDRWMAELLAGEHGALAGELPFVIELGLNHEEQHQELLLTDIKHVLALNPLEPPYRERARTARTSATPGGERWATFDGGLVELGADGAGFAFDNERPRHRRFVQPFELARAPVTCGEYLEFVEAGGYEDERWWQADDRAWLEQDRIRHPLFWERQGSQWQWRGMFELVPLPLAWPVYVSQAEATAYARWRGARLATEAEFQRAAFGAPDGIERQHPWGDTPPDSRHGVFDFTSWDPEPVGSHPAGRSAWGVDDLVGNGWEWTSTPFAPFAGFRPMASYPEYSADFFDGEHFVIKGASPATARELIRPSFRNWFRGRYPYVYATFRCVRDAR